MPFPTRRVAVAAALLTAMLIAIIACAPGAEPDGQTDPSASASDLTAALTSVSPATAQPADRAPATAASPTAAPSATPSSPRPDADRPAATPAAPQPTAATPAVSAPVNADVPAISGIDAWLNTDTELQIADLTAQGKVVLVDFWTYTCVNCIRTLPYLREWWAQYEDDGLVILGIHTPEFEFEKDYHNVADAIATHDIRWPVAQDNNKATWYNFENRYWPAKYLFSSRGQQIYRHFGEGAYGETEQQIRHALVEAGADLSDDPLNLPPDQTRDQAFQDAGNALGRAAVTPELYAGWHRNFLTARAGRPPYVAQQEYFDAILTQDDRTETTTGIMDTTVPSVIHDIQPHRLYFQGQWSVEPERIRHARATQELDDYLALKYAAKSVNAVLTSDSGEPYRVYLTVDGAMMTADNAGADVQWDENGASYVLVDEPRMYGLVDNPHYLPQSILIMGSTSHDFGLFAFTFGVYAEGP